MALPPFGPSAGFTPLALALLDAATLGVMEDEGLLHGILRGPEDALVEHIHPLDLVRDCLAEPPH
eukprot:3082972-Alexandrium_andersonii.AAC.1